MNQTQYNDGLSDNTPTRKISLVEKILNRSQPFRHSYYFTWEREEDEWPHSTKPHKSNYDNGWYNYHDLIETALPAYEDDEDKFLDTREVLFHIFDDYNKMLRDAAHARKMDKLTNINDGLSKLKDLFPIGTLPSFQE